MLTTLHLHVTVYVHCSLHMGPALLHTSIKNKKAATSIYDTTAKYVPATDKALNATHLPHAQIK